MMSVALTNALNEKDVENIYRENFKKKFKNLDITSPFGCDGFAVSPSDRIRCLMEYKDEINLTSKTELAKPVCQAIFYLKKFYDKGIKPPSTVFIGDRSECTVLHVNDILSYLDMDIDWSTAPSSAHTIPELFMKVVQDEKINPFIFNSYDFDKCIDKVKELTQNIQRKVLVTDKNITEVYRYFDEKVLGKSKLTTNEKANLFVQILVNKDENFLHPSKRRRTVFTKSFGEILIASREQFESFFAHFSSSYSPSQKHKLAAVVDRIVEDVTRRKQGEFFTPVIWVDKAHEYIASVYGDDWKEKYVVWDPAWGTGNLTRDYKFKELYVSTLNQSDIDTATQMNYNPEAVKFQFDFLNDNYEKLPEGLRNAIESGREIIVLMNPPYMETSDKTGVVEKTKVGNIMTEQGFGRESKQLFNQFIFNLSNMSDKINICQFTNASLFNYPSYENFRNYMLDNFNFIKGFVINSNEFADVKSWPLSFSILSCKK
jgi:hypothetical protein